MSRPKDTDVVAAAMEPVTLRFVADEFLVGNVEVTFVRFNQQPPAPAGHSAPEWTLFTQWTESLPAEPDLTTSTAIGKVTVVRWVARAAAGDDAQPTRTCMITCNLRGQGTSGAPVRSASVNRVRFSGMSVTRDAVLRNIMLHEFVTRDATGAIVFDREPLEQVVQSLTLTQRKFLAQYEIGSRVGRLVVFATLTGPMRTRRMWSDNTPEAGQTRSSVVANAEFAVFHCRGVGEQVTLVMYTRQLVINMVNPQTASFFRGPQNGKQPTQWLSPNNPAPPRFVSASTVGHHEDMMVWSRIFTSGGKDIMRGNWLHGEINTVGCWMLFRNYNWPQAHREEFFRIFFRHLRENYDAVAANRELAALGYNVPSDATSPVIGSFSKFLYIDHNYAHTFFMRHVVGIQYFSNGASGLHEAMNQHQTHGLVLEPSFPRAALLPASRRAHCWTYRRLGRTGVPGDPTADPTFVADGTLWGDNQMGFKTAEDFIPANKYKQNLTVAELEQCGWADWYFFKPESLSVTAATAWPVERAP